MKKLIVLLAIILLPFNALAIEPLVNPYQLNRMPVIDKTCIITVQHPNPNVELVQVCVTDGGVVSYCYMYLGEIFLFEHDAESRGYKRKKLSPKENKFLKDFFKQIKTPKHKRNDTS